MVKKSRPPAANPLRFVDLFAGLGGFHLALSHLGHRCVFASEIDAELREVYRDNFGLEAHGDIREVSPEAVPEHDILAAGFPCQPFSKAGGQIGLRQRKYLRLLRHVLRIIEHHKPRFVVLENVPNLANHDEGRTWSRMQAELEDAGYAVQHAILSPHRFGIPQIRERMIIVGARGGLGGFEWPKPRQAAEPSISDILEQNPPDAKPLTPQAVECLEVWQQFIQRFPKDQHLPTYPIWTMEFGATYPFEGKTPFALGGKALAGFRGAQGVDLGPLPPGSRLAALPSYAQTEQEEFPDWKKDFIRWNRKLYQDNCEWMDEWLPLIRRFSASLQKLEWNYKGGERDIWKHIIQFRPSGVRVKRPTSSPSLIAMNTTQVPIIAWERRYITARECLHLQSMDQLRRLPESQSAAFRALGNAVNVKIVELVAEALLRQNVVQADQKAIQPVLM